MARTDGAADPAAAAAQAVLAVDLDGTLLRSDMLVETFWAALPGSLSSLPQLLSAARQGRAALKAALVERSTIDVALLPYNEEVMAHIRAARAAGRRTVLITASDQRLADRIAAYLGLFDAVHGSTAQGNLKGAEKAALLDRLYGAGAWDYMGDHAADLEVWSRAAGAVTVNAPAALQVKVAQLGIPVTHLQAERPRARDYLRALRPHQWLKNTLVFLPALAAHRLDAATLGAALLTFVVFSLVASSVYLLNDLLDLAADRAHPRKRNRPLAAGRVPILHGTLLAPALLVTGLALAVPMGAPLVVSVLVYFIVTTAYSLDLKRRLVVDICTLAGLYTMRIVAGGAACGIALSVWLLAFSIFFFFSLASVKRQAELVDGLRSGKTKVGGRGYEVDDLPIISAMAIASGFLSVLVLALYLTSPEVGALYANSTILIGICPILLYWISRTVMITHRGRMHDDPVVFAVRDRISQICLGVIIALAVAGAMA